MSDVAALAIRGLEKSFGTTPVLTGLDLDVPVGSLTAVLGPSGSGKTSLLRLIAGFDRPDAGSVALHGAVVAAAGRFVPPERRGVGYVPQEGALFPHLTVAANIGFGLSRSRRRGARVDELLELVGLRGFGKRMPHELSGGEQQRVALARALAPAPELVLLDEPFSALDPALRASLRADIEVALRAAGATALLVTHDQLEALSLADEVGVIRRGRLVQVAAPATLYREPVDPDVAQFVGDAMLLPARLVDGHAECALGRLPVRGQPGRIGLATAMIRPEQLRLGADVAGVAARVVAVDYYGHDADVRLRLEDGAHEVTARTAEQQLPAVGEVVGVAVVGDVLAYPGSTAGRPVDPAPAEIRDERALGRERRG